MKRLMLGFAAALLMCTGAAAQAPVSFEGKTVTMIIGYPPGGGTDVAGRLIAQYLAKHLPGSPNIIVHNMPGADGVTAMNFFAQQVKPDGLTLTMGSSTQGDPLHYRKPQSQYDATKLKFVGGVGRGGSTVVIRKDAEPRLYEQDEAACDHGVCCRRPPFGHADDSLGYFSLRLERQMGTRVSGHQRSLRRAGAPGRQAAGNRQGQGADPDRHEPRHVGQMVGAAGRHTRTDREDLSRSLQ